MSHALHSVQWMGSFLATIYPPFFELGNLFLLRPDCVPELKDACQVLRSWIYDILFAPQSHRQRKSLGLSGDRWICAIPRAALLSYILDRMDDHLQDATSASLRQGTLMPPFLSYTSSYSTVTFKLCQYMNDHRPKRKLSHCEMPGALLYLR